MTYGNVMLIQVPDMCPAGENIYNLPNLVSIVRILMAPVLFYFALNQQPLWFIAILMFSAFTDVLDGFLARQLNQITTMGSHLDSWGDFTIYSSMAICAWILWPDILLKELVSFTVIVISFTLPVAVGLIKLRTVTSYHTWSVKLAVVVTFIAYILLFTDLFSWPFRLAAVICVYAAIEEIAITCLMRHERVDVRSVWQALKYRKAGN